MSSSTWPWVVRAEYLLHDLGELREQCLLAVVVEDRLQRQVLDVHHCRLQDVEARAVGKLERESRLQAVGNARVQVMAWTIIRKCDCDGIMKTTARDIETD